MNILTKLPYTGNFINTSIDDHKCAIKELICSIVISIMPLWVALIVMNVMNLGNTFYQLVQNGELYVYSATTLAPVIYLVSKERYNSSRFPYLTLYTYTVWIIATLSAIIITIQRVQEKVLDSPWITVSICIYTFSIIVLYTVFVYNNMFLPSPEGIFRGEESNFVAEFQNHRPKLDG